MFIAGLASFLVGNTPSEGLTKSKPNTFRHKTMEYSHPAAVSNSTSRMAVNSRFLVGAVVRYSVVLTKRMSQRSTKTFGIGWTILAQPPSKKVQAMRKSNSQKIVGRSREMLCQGHRERSFISTLPDMNTIVPD